MALRLFITALLAGVSVLALGQEYNPFTIPDSLSGGANAVIRDHHTSIIIEPGKGAKVSVKEATTILNKFGTDAGVFYIIEDQFRKLRSFSGEIQDILGNRIEKISRNDLKDQSLSDGSTLVQDARILYYEPMVNQALYTIVYNYEVELESLIFLPAWMPVSSHGVGLEDGSITISKPEEYHLNIDEGNLPAAPSTVHHNGSVEMTWELSNLKAVPDEPFDPPLKHLVPGISFAPSLFEIEGTSGNMSDWNGFGNWYVTLNEGRASIPEATTAEVQQLISGTDDPDEIVRTIYQYMQEKTRYISIQLGIGGWQATPATEVDRVCYGDCKGLTNYMQGLLNIAGIESYPCLVRAGTRASHIKPDFPSMQFNHVILLVPVNGDTTWLECTSDDLPAGHLGSFTEARDVLLIKKDGSHIIRTPSPPDSLYDISMSCTINIIPDDDAVIESKLFFNAKNYDRLVMINKMQADDRKDYLQELLSVSNLQIAEHDISQNEKDGLKGRVDLTGFVHRFGRVAGRRYFFPLFPFRESIELPPANKERVHDIYISSSFCQKDTVRYKVPPSWELTHLPEELTVDEVFGKITYAYQQNDDTLTIVREFRVNEGTYDRAAYPDFVSFLGEVKRSAIRNVILTRIE